MKCNGVTELSFKDFAKEVLANNPVTHILKKSGWQLDIGYCLEKDEYTIKLQGVAFEDL